MPEENLLSNREEEILQLVATGLTNREIAQKLTISPNTVKVHLSNIFTKINVSSRTEATLYGIEHGIVDVPGSETNSLEADQTSWRDWVKKYSLFWAGLAALVLVFFVTFSTNVLFPAPTPAPVTAVDAAERWQELEPMPEARARMAAAAYNGDIYAIAGQSPDGISGSVFRYDPDSDTWDTLSDKPTPVTDVEAALIGEKLYVPGGLTATGSPTDILEIYDPRNNTWETGASLPQAVSAYALADFEGRMYLFGGWDGQTALDKVYIYNPTENTWREGTAMETTRSQIGATEAGGKIFIVGGWDGEALSDINVSYRPQRDTTIENPWKNEERLPNPMRAFGVLEIAELVFVVAENSSNQSMILQFNTQTNTWNLATENSDQNFFSNAGVASLGGDLIIFGGENMGGELQNTTRRYHAIYTISIPIINR